MDLKADVLYTTLHPAARQYMFYRKRI